MLPIANRPIPLLPEVESFVKRPQRLFIANTFVEPASGQMIPTENPATGDVLAHIPAGDKEDIDRAVAAGECSNQGDINSDNPLRYLG